jgi:hypothetical protein
MQIYTVAIKVGTQYWELLVKLICTCCQMSDIMPLKRSQNLLRGLGLFGVGLSFLNARGSEMAKIRTITKTTPATTPINFLFIVCKLKSVNECSNFKSRLK